MNYFDLTFIAVVSYITIRGLFRGLISELMVLVALVMGFMLATFFHPYLHNFIINIFPDIPEPVIKITSFIAIFVGVNIVVRILANMLNKIATFTFLQPVNKIAGAVFAFTKIVLIFSMVLVLIDLVPGSDYIMDSMGANESVVYSPVKKFGPFMYDLLFSDSQYSFQDIISFDTDSAATQIINKIK